MKRRTVKKAKAPKKAKAAKKIARRPQAPKARITATRRALQSLLAESQAPAAPAAQLLGPLLATDIKVGARFRKDMGDIEALRRSIEARGRAGQPGLLQPVAITPKRELIDGGRRLEAWKRSMFRDMPIPYHVVDVDAIVRGEWDGNDPALRKNFTPSEMVAIKRALEPKLKAEAAERQRAHGGTAPGKTAQKKGEGGRAGDLVAAFAGKSRRSIEKAEKVVEAAEREPALFGALVDEMDRTGKVDAPFKKLQVRQQRAAIQAAPPPLPMNASECETWVIDFPWAGEPEREQAELDDAGRAFRPYAEMSHKSVCQFAREQIAPKLPEKVSVWLWVTNFILVRGYDQHVIAALGFKPEHACTMLTWDKVKIGRGKKLREQTEHAILLTRGNPVIDVFGEDAPTTLIREPRRENSRKPDAFYRLVERVTPARRYASIFSRGGEGALWDSHGDQVGTFAPAIPEAEPTQVDLEEAIAARDPLLAPTSNIEKLPGPMDIAAQLAGGDALGLALRAVGRGDKIPAELRDRLAAEGLIEGKKKLELTYEGAQARRAWEDDAFLKALDALAGGLQISGPLVEDLRAAKCITGTKTLKLTKTGERRLKELQERAAHAAALAALPSDKDGLAAAYVEGLRVLHDAVIRKNAAAIEPAEDVLALVLERAQDVLEDIKRPGRYDLDGAEQIERMTAAPLGEVPMWGQLGMFRLEVDGMACLVEARPNGNLQIHAVDRDAPFFSGSGFHSLFHMPEEDGMGLTVDQAAAALIRENMLGVTDTRTGKMKPRKTAMPKPDRVYRMPASWDQADDGPIEVGSEEDDRLLAAAAHPAPAAPEPAQRAGDWCCVCQLRPRARQDNDCWTCAECAAAGDHVVSMSIDHVDASTSYHVATCKCGWSDKLRRAAGSHEEIDARVRAHWRDVVEASRPGTPMPDDDLAIPDFLRRTNPEAA